MGQIPQPAVTISDSPSDAGEEIQLEGWHASFGRGGCDRAGGTVTAEVARRVFQGMTMKFWIGGVCKWAGPISNNPLVYRGKAELQASGWKQKIERSTGRLPYISRDVSLATPLSGPPWNNPGNEFIGLENRDNQLMVRIQQVTSAVATNGWVVPFPGTPSLSHYAFDWKSQGASANTQLRVYRGTYPANSWTSVQTHSLNATSGTVSQAVTGGGDQLLFNYEVTSGSAGEGYWLILYNLQFHGIVGNTVTFTTSQVVTDILRRLGFDTSGVQSSGVNAMPFDHQSGSWWDALLYQAFLDDRAAPNIVPSDDGRERLGLYHPWGKRVHTVSLENAEFDLNALEIVNGVVVSYPHVGGFTAEVTVRPSDIGETDPLAGRDADNFLHISLQDPQPDSLLAENVGKNVLRRTIRLRFEGSGEIPELSDAVLWDMLHGHELNVADWGPLEAQRLPIDSVSLAQGRPARVSIYSPGAELGLADRHGLANARKAQNPELVAVEVIQDTLATAEHDECHGGKNKWHHGEKHTERHQHLHLVANDRPEKAGPDAHDPKPCGKKKGKK